MDIQFNNDYLVFKKTALISITVNIGELYDGNSSTWRDKGQVKLASYMSGYDSAQLSEFTNNGTKNAEDVAIPYYVDGDEVFIARKLITGFSYPSTKTSISLTIDCETQLAQDFLSFVQVNTLLPVAKDKTGNPYIGRSAYFGWLIKHWYLFWWFKK